MIVRASRTQFLRRLNLTISVSHKQTDKLDWLTDEGELTLDNLDWFAEGKRTLAGAALVLQSTAALGAGELRWGGALGIILHP